MKRIGVIVGLLGLIFFTIILLVSSTYSLVTNIDKDNDSNIKLVDIFYNDDGSYKEVYYEVRYILKVSDNDMNMIMNSKYLNDVLKILIEESNEYNINNTIKFSNNEIYNLIKDAVMRDDLFNDDIKSNIINVSSKYIDVISNYIYNQESF